MSWTDDQNRTLRDVAYAVEVLRAAKPEEDKAWWRWVLDSESLKTILSVGLGALLTFASTSILQSRQDRKELLKEQEARAEATRAARLDVAVRVQKSVASILVGGENL